MLFDCLHPNLPQSQSTAHRSLLCNYQPFYDHSALNESDRVCIVECLCVASCHEYLSEFCGRPVVVVAIVVLLREQIAAKQPLSRAMAGPALGSDA